MTKAKVTKGHPGTAATPAGEARRQAEAREAHILGDGPRLQPIELNEVSSGLLKILERLETVNGALQSNAKAIAAARSNCGHECWRTLSWLPRHPKYWQA